MEEVWRVIEDFPTYSVSSKGRFRNLITGRILKGYLNKKGYINIGLINNSGTQVLFKAHRLVARAFIINPENKPHVNHINLIKTDNRVENLEWCTNLENVEHYLKSTNRTLSVKKIRMKGHFMVPVVAYDKQGKIIQEFKSIKEATLTLKVSKDTIRKILRGRTCSMHPYIWKTA